MNMQMIMQQAKKMQAQLMKEQEELAKTEYEGSSSLVNVKINGKYEVLSVKINLPEGENIEFDDSQPVVTFEKGIYTIKYKLEKQN
jgi:DNA-binding protein YbaB